MKITNGKQSIIIENKKDRKKASIFVQEDEKSKPVEVGTFKNESTELLFRAVAMEMFGKNTKKGKKK